MLRAMFLTVVGDTDIKLGRSKCCGIGLELKVSARTPGFVFMCVCISYFCPLRGHRNNILWEQFKILMLEPNSQWDGIWKWGLLGED